MRFGLRLRRRHAAEPLEALSNRPEAETGDLTSVTLPTVDEPGRQLSLEALDEPAEILVRIAPEALAGDAELSGEIGEIEGHAKPEQPAEVAEVEVAEAEAPEAEQPAEVAEAAETEELVAGAEAPEPEQPPKPAETAETVSDAMPVDPGAASEVSGDELIDQSSAFAEEDLRQAETFAPSIELEVQPEPYRPVEPQLLDQPLVQIRLARLHLKTGSLTTARAELEMLASRDSLDMTALLDLAEARWRTGDLDGAGDAATAYLADGGTEALGFVIAAEAAATGNRQADARRHTEEALARHLSELDRVFAGMPRKAMWPPSAWAAGAPATPTVEPTAATAAVAAWLEPGAVSEPAARVLAETGGLAAEPLESGPVESSDAGATATNSVVEPGAEVAVGRSCLLDNEPLIAALHFGVAIRLAPELAGVVLEAIGERQDLPLQLVRGDALWLLGLEGDAGRTYLSVAGALRAPRSVPPEPEPARPLRSP